MKFHHRFTGDTMEVPPPDELGASSVIFNGQIVEHCLYSDDNGGTVTIADGRVFTADNWTAYLLDRLEHGWRP